MAAMLNADQMIIARMATRETEICQIQNVVSFLFAPRMIATENCLSHSFVRQSEITRHGRARSDWCVFIDLRQMVNVYVFGGPEHLGKVINLSCIQNIYRTLMIRTFSSSYRNGKLKNYAWSVMWRTPLTMCAHGKNGQSMAITPWLLRIRP